MAFHLTVAGSLEPLADALAAELSVPLPDPFTTEIVVVPGDGVRAWLVAHLANEVAVTSSGGDGIVANVEYLFPAGLVRRIVGEVAGLGAWSVGPLGWAVYDVLLDRGDEFGQEASAVRARTLADLFDRYSLYRRAMVLRWSRGDDVDVAGAPLDEHQRWQPALWRAVCDRLGGTTDAERMVEFTTALGEGRLPAELLAEVPERVFLFGLASLPVPHLDVLAALSAHREVHVLAPVASAARWHQVRDRLRLPLSLPVLRADPQVPVGEGHPLVTGWGRTSREAQLLLLDASARTVASIVVPPAEPAPLPVDATVLARLQNGLQADVPPRGAPAVADPPLPDERPALDRADTSIRWHRAYGPARQVEVLRDALLHLLEERLPDGTPRYQPRDIAVLCTDVGRFAPLVEATFAGDPTHGVPALPVQVADRTLRQDNPILDAAAALLDLLDGRFRSSAVLAFAARTPVRLRFGLDADAVGRLGEWAAATNVRWGLGPADHARFGLPPDINAHTWQAGLDQLLVGATMADAGPRLGPGDVAPFGDIEGDAVGVAGAFAELVHHLGRAVAALSTPGRVDDWSTALADALRSLCEVPDTDSWQWRPVEQVIEEFRAEAQVAGVPRAAVVEPADLAVLLRGRLTGGAGRPRFGTGAVTVSSLIAQRGVPHPVVCLLGLDDDIGAGGLPTAEDLVAGLPCVGDRDTRSEQRAQLLDAVLAAGERLLVLSTGRDVRTNAEVPPVVALAELFDTIDATVRLVAGDATTPPAARTALIVDHPRQAWSELGFRPGVLGVDGPWSFDEGALDAARARREQTEAPAFLPDALPPPDLDLEGVEVIALGDLLAVCANPAQVFLRDRLGISIPSTDETPDDEIPLAVASLDEWKLADALLGLELGVLGPDAAAGVDVPDADRAHDADAAEAEERWEQFERRRGAVPPLAFADAALADVRVRVDALVDGLVTELAGRPFTPDAVSVEVAFADHGGRDVVVAGVVPGVCGDLVVEVTASKLKAKHLLTAWVRLAVLALHDPSRPWESLTVGAQPSNTTKAAVQRLRLRSPEAAARVLEVVVDLHRRALCDTVPAFPETTRFVWMGEPGRARGAWGDGWRGEGDDRWTARAFPYDFDGLLALPLRPDERVDGGSPSSRLHVWANRLWGTLADTALLGEGAPGGAGLGDDEADA